MRRLAFVSAAASILFPAVAQADDTTGGGIFCGYAFGERTGFEWGFEAFFMKHTGGPTSGGSATSLTSGLGPLVQFALIGLSDPRISVALTAGSEVTRPYQGALGSALKAELGGTYRFGDRPGFGIHTGLAFEYLFYVSVRRQWLLGDNAVGGGIRFPPGFHEWPPPSQAGRPLRTRHGLARIDERARSIGAASSTLGPKNEMTALAGRAWERDAQYECASIPAFLQLARELLTHGAPESLVEQALSAAEDEIVHAKLCADLASRYLRARVWPTLPQGVEQAEPRAGSNMIRLATESWLDGCLAEGAAAARAARAAGLAWDPVAKVVQQNIARDEARHAELGWNILKWTMRSGGADVRDAVSALAGTEFSPSADVDGSERYGRLGKAETRDVTERHFARSRDRLHQMLGTPRAMT
jgi:hypothetical protein